MIPTPSGVMNLSNFKIRTPSGVMDLSNFNIRSVLCLIHSNLMYEVTNFKLISMFIIHVIK